MNNIVFLRKSRVIEELQSVVSFKDVQFCTITRKPITPPKKKYQVQSEQPQTVSDKY